MTYRQKGQNNNASKLTWADVDEMRVLRWEGWTLKRLAARYGVSLTTIGRVCLAQTWRRDR
jgi:hypothetical protein